MIGCMMSSRPTERRIAFSSVTCLAAFIALSVHAADRLTTGHYEFTVTPDGKTQSLPHCLTTEVAKSANCDICACSIVATPAIP